MKRVVVAGTFDGIHPGHRSFISQARTLGDELVVIVARDSTVERVKGCAPQQSEQQRCVALRSLKEVSEVILGDDSGDFLKIVVQLRPEVLALGYDQWPKVTKITQELHDRGLLNIQVIRLKPYGPNRYHTSILRKQERTDS